jgi:protoheme IX farnesyltransferase
MMSLQELSDRMEIEHLIVHYANSIDQRNWDGLDQVFTPDAYIDYRKLGGIDGRYPQIKAWLGTALAAGGTLALNQFVERDTDALMERTRRRPLPDARMRPSEALAFGAIATSAGLLYLLATTNLLCAIVTVAITIVYLGAYTPLKRFTWMCNVIGAIPGALPPVAGWAAARGSIAVEPVLLFAIMFLWQIPHFLAIAWIYREDYARGGFPMLPVLDPAGHITGRQAVANCLALLLVSVVPSFAGMTSRVYLWGAIGLGVAFTSVAIAAATRRTTAAARALFLASVVYLTLLSALLLTTRV